MSDLAAGTLVAGRYRIVARLGEGGMGAVYRAVQEPLGREVALKVIAPALAVDADAVERFRREAKAASSLAHPNIVTVFDFGADGARLFLATELIAGVGLDQLVTAGPTPPVRSVPILRGICAALAEAHAAGVIHRDLKPPNVMLTSTSTQRDVAKVVDFGIARLADGSRTLTHSGSIVGTPGYIAPELFDGHEPSAASDLYALGVLAYELLSGRAPFRGRTPMERMKSAILDEPAPLSPIPGDVPSALEALVVSLLAKDPSRRPESAVDVDAALARLVLDASVVVPVVASVDRGDAAPIVPLAPNQRTEAVDVAALGAGASTGSALPATSTVDDARPTAFLPAPLSATAPTTTPDAATAPAETTPTAARASTEPSITFQRTKRLALVVVLVLITLRQAGASCAVPVFHAGPTEDVDDSVDTRSETGPAKSGAQTDQADAGAGDGTAESVATALRPVIDDCAALARKRGTPPRGTVVIDVDVADVEGKVKLTRAAWNEGSTVDSEWLKVCAALALKDRVIGERGRVGALGPMTLSFPLDGGERATDAGP